MDDDHDGSGFSAHPPHVKRKRSSLFFYGLLGEVPADLKNPMDKEGE
jgi:hypothetical protein